MLTETSPMPCWLLAAPAHSSLGGGMTFQITCARHCADLALATPARRRTRISSADLQRAKQREAASGDCKAVQTDYWRIAGQAKNQPRGRCRGVAPGRHLSWPARGRTGGDCLWPDRPENLPTSPDPRTKRARDRRPPRLRPSPPRASRWVRSRAAPCLLDLFIAGGEFPLSGTAFDFSPDGTKVVHGKSIASPKQRTNLLVVRGSRDRRRADARDTDCGFCDGGPLLA